MVFQDLGYAFDTEKNNHSLKAPVLADRIVACFVDIVLNSPFLFLFLSPLIRLFEENNFYGDLEVSWNFFLAVFFMGFHLFVISIALQTHLLGHTFGQKIMQIEIVHTIKNFSQKQTISFWSSFQRSYGYGISLLFFGLPLLEMMIHPQRFSFYERMSNSYAVSKAHRFDFPPTILEILFARIILSFAFGAIILFGSISFVKKIESQKVASLMAMRDRGFLCEDLPAELQLPIERLEMAIAHYYVTNKKDCLLMEEKNISQMDTKFTEIDEQHKDMFYLARSITHSDPEINLDYENKICQENNQNLLSADWKESCLLAQFFSERSSESREDHNSELQIQLQQIPKKSLISLLILQDHFRSDKNYEMSFAYWKRIQEKSNLTAAIEKNQTQKLSALAYLIQSSSQEFKAQRGIASVSKKAPDQSPQSMSLSKEEKEVFSVFETSIGLVTDKTKNIKPSKKVADQPGQE